MALIKCPECGNQVSDKAVSCPNCGYPIASINSNSISHPRELGDYTTKQNPTNNPHHGKMAKLLIFDNCNKIIIKEAFVLAADRLGVIDISSRGENTTTPEHDFGMNNSRLGLLYSDSDLFKSNRTFVCVFEDIDNKRIDVTNLNKFLNEFKEAISEIATQVILYKESHAEDIIKKYEKAHFQVIFDEEQELGKVDIDNVRPDVDVSYRSIIRSDSEKVHYSNNNTQTQNEEQFIEQALEPYTVNTWRIVRVILAAFIVPLLFLQLFGVVDFIDLFGGRTAKYMGTLTYKDALAHTYVLTLKKSGSAYIKMKRRGDESDITQIAFKRVYDGESGSWRKSYFYKGENKAIPYIIVTFSGGEIALYDGYVYFDYDDLTIGRNGFPYKKE